MQFVPKEQLRVRQPIYFMKIWNWFSKMWNWILSVWNWISLVWNWISLVWNWISLVWNWISFVWNWISFVWNWISFVRNRPENGIDVHPRWRQWISVPILHWLVGMAELFKISIVFLLWDHKIKAFQITRSQRPEEQTYRCNIVFVKKTG